MLSIYCRLLRCVQFSSVPFIFVALYGRLQTFHCIQRQDMLQCLVRGRHSLSWTSHSIEYRSLYRALRRRRHVNHRVQLLTATHARITHTSLLLLLLLMMLQCLLAEGSRGVNACHRLHAHLSLYTDLPKTGPAGLARSRICPRQFDLPERADRVTATVALIKGSHPLHVSYTYAISRCSWPVSLNLFPICQRIPCVIIIIITWHVAALVSSRLHVTGLTLLRKCDVLSWLWAHGHGMVCRTTWLQPNRYSPFVSDLNLPVCQMLFLIIP